jgi:uncharacterized DUF497 family protein
MRYEWDEAKRLANLKKHKLDFDSAWRVYEHPNKVTVADFLRTRIGIEIWQKLMGR